ncbi:MAG TPA: hypothetical protein VII44_03605 [Puia sp.]
MRSKGKYKFKVINGILSWKNDEMERFIPVSAEILTRVILLYEKEFKNGIRIWRQLAEHENQGMTTRLDDPLLHELATWMEQLQGIFANTEPFREKEKWMDDQIHLN